MSKTISKREMKAAELEKEAKALRQLEKTFWSEVEERLHEIVECHKAKIAKILAEMPKTAESTTATPAKVAEAPENVDTSKATGELKGLPQ